MDFVHVGSCSMLCEVPASRWRLPTTLARGCQQACRYHLTWNFTYDPTAHTRTAIRRHSPQLLYAISPATTADYILLYRTACPLRPTVPPVDPQPQPPSHHPTITPRDVAVPTKSIKVLCKVLLGVTALSACLHSPAGSHSIVVCLWSELWSEFLAAAISSSQFSSSPSSSSFLLHPTTTPQPQPQTLVSTIHPPSITPSHCPLTYTHSHLLMAP
jgi:hypothetical protein